LARLIERRHEGDHPRRLLGLPEVLWLAEAPPRTTDLLDRTAAGFRPAKLVDGCPRAPAEVKLG
jgi:hypothetical protein